MLTLDSHSLNELTSNDLPGLSLELEARVRSKLQRAGGPRNLTSAFEFVGREITRGPLLLYGAGSHSRELVPALEETPGVVIEGFVDARHKTVTEFMGYEVLSPADPRVRRAGKVLVAHCTAEHDMVSELTAQGVPHDRILTVYTNDRYVAQTLDSTLRALEAAALIRPEYVILDDAPGVFDTATLARLFSPLQTLLLRVSPGRPSTAFRTVDAASSLNLTFKLLQRLKPRVVYVRTQFTSHFLACLVRMALPSATIVHELHDFSLLTWDDLLTDTGCMTRDEVRTTKLAELDSLRKSSLVLSKRNGPVFTNLQAIARSQYEFVYPWVLERPSASVPSDGKPDGVRIVYAGQLWPSSMGAILRGEWDYLPVFERLTQHSLVSIDIYNSLHVHDSQDSFFQEFIDCADAHPAITYHRGCRYREMIKKMACFSYGYLYADSPNDANIDRAEAVSARLTGYLNAQLPVILDDGLDLMAGLVRDFGAGVILPRHHGDRLVPDLLAAHTSYAAMKDGARRLHAHMLDSNEQVVARIQALVERASA
jgi:hypothetical protein